jgi:predicted metal-dependent peptidase
MNSNIKKRISQVKAALLIEQPYFGEIASSLKPKQNDDIQTFKSSPTNFEYNDIYIDMLSDEELGFLLTNSAMHQALGYRNRKEGRADWLWIMANDYTINSLLVNNGLEIPDGLLYDDRFDGLSSEAIYKILEDEIDSDKHSPKQVENIKYEKMPQTNEYDTDPIEDIHQQAINKAKLMGELPLGIEIIVPNIFDGNISWEDEIYTIIENSIKFDYRLSPPNKRYLSQGIALPSLSGDMAKIIVVIDSSGSIDIALLGRFLGEVDAIMNSFNSFEIEFLVADAKVWQHDTLYAGDTLEYNLKGGGGTNFEQTFKYIDNNIQHHSLVLYFTDGVGKYPKDTPPYDVVWVMPKNTTSNPPFGEIVYI